MPITLKAVAGASDSNSYATRDEASAILAGRASTGWAAATDEKRDAALIEATAELEQRFTWRGERAETSQALSFPRIGLERNEIAGPANTIPTELIRAAALYADFLLSGGASPGGVIAVGSIRRMRVQAKDALPGHVLAAITSSWISSHIGSSVGSVALDGTS